MAQGAYPALDAKVYPVQASQQANPIDTLSQYAQLQNLLLSNQTNQQTLAARKAIGSAYSQAINPQTGQLDSNKLMSIIANDPNAAYLAGDVAAQAQARQEEQYKINQAQLSQTGNRLGVYKSAFGPLLANPNAGPTDVYSTIKGLAAAGMPVDEIAGDVAATMPVMDPSKANDPAYQQQYNQAFHGWLQNQWGSNLSGETQASVFRPSVSLVNTGGAVQGIDTNPTTNPAASSTALPTTLNPAQAVAPVGGVTPGGVPFSEPTSKFAMDTGNGNLVAGGGGGGVSGSIFGTGRLPGRGAPYSGPPANAPGNASSPNAPPGTLQTGLAPGQAAGASAAGTGSANDMHNLYQSVTTSGVRLYQLNQALSSLQALGTTGTGPGSDTRNAVMSYLQSVPGIGGIIGGDPTKIANYDEANKYLTAYASNQAANLGYGTDAKLATALSANASTHISNLAAVNVVKATIGLERMQQAQAQAFSQTGLPAASYDQWSANWNKTADGRAYAFDLMSPQQRQSVLGGMTGTTRTQFLNQVWNAAQAGFIDPGKLGLTSGSAGGATTAPTAAAPNGPSIDPSTGLPVGIAP